jgi:hypothetical protein
MYIIINKTRQTCDRHTGNFPNLDKLLNKGDKIIIISLYSNTIKVPYFIECNDIKEWDWEDFPIDANVLLPNKLIV